MSRQAPATQYSCRYLVLGSGLAGLSFALRVADFGPVFIITKHQQDSSNTRWAQGGVSAVFSPEDSIESHIADTLEVGAGLCRPDMVRHAVERGPELVSRLADEFSIEFDRIDDRPNAPFELGREGGHSFRRIVHAQDMTGAAIEKGLLRAVAKHPNIRIFEHHAAIDLLSWSKVDGTKGCFGCYALDIQSQQIVSFLASVTILATGGAGKVYRYTSNPDVATGDGIAMAYRIGAKVGNLEFIQFHPTCLYHPDAKNFLISEALRGEGGILRSKDGNAFMEGRHPLSNLAPRDVVARAIDGEIKRTGEKCVYLDMTHLDPEFLLKRFPGIHARCFELGIDMRVHPIPVVPAAHYICGGIVVDPFGRTSIPQLLAIGESAMSGMHGACRLASNSLLEALVLADGAASIVEDIRRAPPPQADPWNKGDAVESDEMVMVTANWEEVRAIMWNFVGIVRSNKRLQRAQRRLELIREEIDEYYWRFFVTRDVIELRNLTLIGQLIVRCAQIRQESRGLHYTLDYPSSENNTAHETIFCRTEGPPS